MYKSHIIFIDTCKIKHYFKNVASKKQKESDNKMIKNIKIKNSKFKIN